MTELDTDAVRGDVLAVVARIAPSCLKLAERTLEQIRPRQWQIEWYLPWWLGCAFGLDTRVAHEFVLSNVLGLAAIRLSDDFADGEVKESARQSASELVDALFHAAFEFYHPYFSRNTSFWKHVGCYMQAWRAATVEVNQLEFAHPARLQEPESGPARCIADLGAPLKISAFAVCQLTGNDSLRALEKLLDHIVIATVLYDHAVDADVDLRAGRRNLFIACASTLPQTPPFESENRARMVQAWMANKLPDAYFEQIAFHVSRARQMNQELGISPLTCFLDNIQCIARRTREEFAQQYRDRLVNATRSLFGEIYETARNPKGGTISPTPQIQPAGLFLKERNEYGKPR